MNSEKLGETAQPDVPKAEVVMKICLIASVVLSAGLIVLAVAGKRSILDVSGSILSLLALQWFFYMMAKRKRNSDKR